MSLLVITAGSASAIAADGFKTQTHVPWFGTTKANFGVLKVESAEECRFPGEEKPAAQDPNGNWGEPAEGLQLSLRFEKSTFQIGEPVVATIIVRNVAGTTVGDSVALPNATEFVVVTKNGVRLDRVDIFRPNPTEEDLRRRTVMKTMTRQLEPGEQWKYKLALSDAFNFESAGTYHVSARRKVWKADLMPSQAASGIATIHFVASQTNPPTVHDTNIAGQPPAWPASAGSTSSFAATTRHERSDMLPKAVLPPDASHATPTMIVAPDGVEPTPPGEGSEKPGISPSTRTAMLALVVLAVGGGLGFFIIRRARRTVVGGTH